MIEAQEGVVRWSTLDRLKSFRQRVRVRSREDVLGLSSAVPDTHVRIVGPAAADLARLSIDFWNRHITRQEPITRHYPRRFDARITFLSTDVQRLTFPIRNRYLGAIERAEQTIRLSNADVVPDGTLFEALKAAARRGMERESCGALDLQSRGRELACTGLFYRMTAGGHPRFWLRSMLHEKTVLLMESGQRSGRRIWIASVPWAIMRSTPRWRAKGSLGKWKRCSPAMSPMSWNGRVHSG